MNVYDYDGWVPRAMWHDAGQGSNPFDNVDFHVDLGCGTLPKGRIGVDRYPAPGVNVLCDFETLSTFASPREPGGDAVACEPIHGLPFEDDSIQSIISHHCLEHVGEGFLPLMEDVHRVLTPGGLLRIIVPVFPSWSAVSDPDHCRFFMADVTSGASTFDAFFVDDSGHSWLESFSVPYIGTAKFQRLGLDVSPPTPMMRLWTTEDAREMRIAMSAWKG